MHVGSQGLAQALQYGPFFHFQRREAGHYLPVGLLHRQQVLANVPVPMFVMPVLVPLHKSSSIRPGVTQMTKPAIPCKTCHSERSEESKTLKVRNGASCKRFRSFTPFRMTILAAKNDNPSPVLVIPAKAGISQWVMNSGFRRNDNTLQPFINATGRPTTPAKPPRYPAATSAAARPGCG